jgi:hypothetical protein
VGSALMSAQLMVTGETRFQSKRREKKRKLSASPSLIRWRVQKQNTAARALVPGVTWHESTSARRNAIAHRGRGRASPKSKPNTPV